MDLCSQRKDKLAPLDKIIEKVLELKIDKGAVKAILNDLKGKGLVFEPKKDKWGLVDIEQK